MAQHLLVAADQYGMERLKLLYEDNICKSISLGTVDNILALAELHNCNNLKDDCIDFLISSYTIFGVLYLDTKKIAEDTEIFDMKF
ncbi:hypothetical protein QYE76_010170 [Lolium multiflorum]|uniref:BPM/SPOP BACK domain-containing protein n=1 Tax=Lolium multiflorum TaxID=4521 RepID=A0AAD8TWE7_LOLMU|nr:hypothetical protein QYE76_010170 [Lolium multiflorum]